MERRRHHRARLRLPARIRWMTPFGQHSEVCQTIDISRSGLRVPCSVPARPGTHLWVTFPYDASLPVGQPEMPARVVRCEPHFEGQAEVAVQFGSCAATLVARGNGMPPDRERRARPRRLLAVPVRVRPDHLPWFEETMTLDVSAAGVRFLSMRQYEAGSHLFLSFDPSSFTPWPGGGEVRTAVVRAEPACDANAIAVSVCGSDQ